MATADDGGDRHPVATQREVIEDTVGTLMQALRRVSRDRCHTSPDLSTETHLELQSSVLSTISLLRPYSRLDHVKWDEIGPEDTGPDELVTQVQQGQTRTADTTGRGSAGAQETAAFVARADVLELFAADLLHTAKELHFYPQEDISKDPIHAGPLYEVTENGDE